MDKNAQTARSKKRTLVAQLARLEIQARNYQRKMERLTTHRSELAGTGSSAACRLVGGCQRAFFSPDAGVDARDDYEIYLRTGVGGIGACPWYEEAIDLATVFHCAPEDPFKVWDKVWLDRARVILQARRIAAIDTSRKQ